MAVKTIETRAVISAQDKTGATFAQVAQKLRGMENAAAHASKRMDSLARGMSGVWQKQQQHADIARRMSSITPVVAGGGFLGMSAAQRERALQAAAQAGAAVAMTAPIVKKVVQQSAARIHENLRMATSGMTPAEITDAQGQMSRLFRQYRQIPSTQIGATIRGGRTIVGSYEEAVAAADPLLKLTTVLGHVSKGLDDAQLAEQNDALIRAADLTGMTKNLKSLTTFVDGVGKALLVFGDSVKPVNFFQAAQRAGAAATQWSPEFISGVLPSLIQTMGGDPAGTSLGSLFSAVVAGRMKNKSVKILNDLGLLDPSKVLWNKVGDVKGVMPGGLRGSDLALSNPYRYALEYVLPALTKKGITDPKRMTEILAGAFSDKKVAQIMTHMILNRAQIDRDVALGKGAMPFDEAFKKITREDPNAVAKGLTNSLGELERVLGQDVTPKLTTFGAKLSDTITDVSMALDKDPLLRGAAIAGGLAGSSALAHLGLSFVGGYFGGPGAMATLAKLAPLLRFAGPVGAVASIGAFGYNMYGNYRTMSAMLDRGDAKMKEKAEFIDRSPEALATRIAIRDMANMRNTGGFELGAGVKKIGRGKKARLVPSAYGDEAGSVAPGKLAFGFGEFGMNEKAATETYSHGRGALLHAPRNKTAEDRAKLSSIADALRNAPPQRVDINVTAEPMKIENTVQVAASSELIRIAEGAKTATREAKLSAKASGPGTTGSTDFGNQH